MSEQHTPGTLGVTDETLIVTDENDDGLTYVASVYCHVVRGRSEANAKRLVAAWNACQGIDTKDLESGSVNIIQRLHDQAAKNVLTQRNTLLMTLDRLLKSDPTGAISTASDELLEQAANDENADQVVREQAAALLQARIVMADIEGGTA